MQKDELITDASIEMRDPITAIKILGYLLRKRIDILNDEKAWGLLYKINKQIDKLVKLIQNSLPMVKKPF